jgi:hypothetical protein
VGGGFRERLEGGGFGERLEEGFEVGRSVKALVVLTVAN